MSIGLKIGVKSMFVKGRTAFRAVGSSYLVLQSSGILEDDAGDGGTRMSAGKAACLCYARLPGYVCCCPCGTKLQRSRQRFVPDAISRELYTADSECDPLLCRMPGRPKVRRLERQLQPICVLLAA